MDTAAQPFLVEIPDFALVVLVGPSSSGKSSLARRFFRANEVLSSDSFRELVAGDAGSMEATQDAMAVLHDLLDRRLARRLLTVVDTTALYPQDRQALLEIGRKHYAPCIAVVLDTPLETCLAFNQTRSNPRKPGSIERMVRRLSGQVSLINKEKWTKSVRLHPRRMERLDIRRTPLRTDLRHLAGPFDIVGDVHGCSSELRTLLQQLGYQPLAEGDGYAHPEGRILAFVGDLIDRGPDPVGTLRLAAAMVETGTGLWAMGNHDIKLQRWLAGREQNDNHGFGETRRALEAEFERDPISEPPS